MKICQKYYVWHAELYRGYALVNIPTAGCAATAINLSKTMRSSPSRFSPSDCDYRNNRFKQETSLAIIVDDQFSFSSVTVIPNCGS